MNQGGSHVLMEYFRARINGVMSQKEWELTCALNTVTQNLEDFAFRMGKKEIELFSNYKYLLDIKNIFKCTDPTMEEEIMMVQQVLNDYIFNGFEQKYGRGL